MIKKFLSSLSDLIDRKIFFVMLSITIIAAFLRVRVIPDAFQLSGIQNKRDFIFRLLTTALGFSGLILTVLLVIYNFYIKTLRRNTIDFIFESKWLKTTFSLFFSEITTLSISFMLIDKVVIINSTTLTYLALIQSVLFVLSLFPLAILTIKDAYSIDRIKRVVDSINTKYIEEVYKPNNAVHDVFVREIEKNPIIILKDLSITAINERDWILPQTVLNGLFDKLIKPLNNEIDKYEVNRNISVWCFVCNHLKEEIIKCNDSVTANVLLGYNYKVHYHFIGNTIVPVEKASLIDRVIIDFYRLIFINNKFFDLQPYVLKHISELINDYISSIQYSDDELPTFKSSYASSTSIKYDDPIQRHWHYVKTELPDIFYETFKHAVEAHNKYVYDNFDWRIDNILTKIVDSKLTEFQKEELLDEYLLLHWKLYSLLIGNKISINLHFSSITVYVSIQKWDYAIRLLYQHCEYIKAVNREGYLSNTYIDDFFLIARSLIQKRVGSTGTILIAVESIVDTAIEIIEDKITSQENRYYIEYQFDWLLKTFIKDSNEYISFDKLNKVKNLIKDYKYDPKFFK